ncbi:hypothetical protein DPMN_042217 [Dreissena polymorpha]|uniref:Uncharacterized protein n=1 Tax=Dreissena polymorpha TaxID=45954 RepID=A0A9D4HWS6_DREPO|nr:hypothetical protein DPMN_042217 [Dreissena polymorpha]
MEKKPKRPLHDRSHANHEKQHVFRTGNGITVRTSNICNLTCNYMHIATTEFTNLPGRNIKRFPKYRPAV